MEKIINFIINIVVWAILIAVAILEVIAKAILLALFIPMLFIFIIICPILRMEETPKFFQKLGEYMSENYLRGAKYLKKYYLG